MLSPLGNRTYRNLFAAQVVALLGTGLATVALGLLAYDLAGANAGAVLGTALAIKMIAYVGVAPVANVIAERLPRRALLVTMDAVRAAIALTLPFVDQIWQIYCLIFLLQSASATFTPAFQATIPDVLPDEREYTHALSLSRLAYELEGLLSPALAAAALAVVGFHWLFAGTAIGFVASAALVASTAIPPVVEHGRREGFYRRATRGTRILLATPRLRGLLALNLAAAAAGAMVIVNTVVYVQGVLSQSAAQVAVALAVFGGGSMLAALLLPRALERISDRAVMIPAAGVLTAVLAAMAVASQGGAIEWHTLLAAWLVLGLCFSALVTPAGRLLRRSCHREDRPALFAAHFALSHACWLLTYPMAGWLGARFGMDAAFLALALLAGVGTLCAVVLWPAGDPRELEHTHETLPADHPHVSDAVKVAGGVRHAHAFVIDDFHPRWPY